MTKEMIVPDNVHQPAGYWRYSHAIKVGNTIYLSGQAGADVEGNIVEGDCGAQATQIFENMKRVLEAAGATMQDVVKLNFYFSNIAEDMPKIRDPLRKYFGRHRPAETVLQVGSLFTPSMLLEVEAVAIIE